MHKLMNRQGPVPGKQENDGTQPAGRWMGRKPSERLLTNR